MLEAQEERRGGDTDDLGTEHDHSTEVCSPSTSATSRHHSHKGTNTQFERRAFGCPTGSPQCLSSFSVASSAAMRSSLSTVGARLLRRRVGHSCSMVRRTLAGKPGQDSGGPTIFTPEHEAAASTSVTHPPAVVMANTAPTKYDFDLLVVGSGPAAQACAVSSSRRGKKVAMIDRPGMLGGVCVNTGTIPSKTFREAVLHLSGYRHQGFYGKSYVPTERIGMDGILHRVSMVVKGEKEVMVNRLRRYNITQLFGSASFTGDEHTVQVVQASLEEDPALRTGGVGPEPFTKPFTADKILLAVGTRPARRPDMAFDGVHIIDSDDLLSGSLKKVPSELMVVGAGVIGLEYASMFNVIPGVRVTVIDSRPDLLTFADKEVIQSLEYEMRQKGARFLLGEDVLGAKVEGDRVTVTLASGKLVRGDCLLYTVGRQGATDSLSLEKIGLELNNRGLITVDDNYQTKIPYIYAAGDCIGFPALASTSSQQGRLAAHHMWGAAGELADFSGFPYGIYTIPEISMVGYTEQQLTQDKVPYDVGIARYDELAKGQMLGVTTGMLKIIFHADTLKILGVHCIGENATEIVHVGQLAMDHDLDLYYFTETVFNYPTFAEAYRSAAFNGIKRLGLYRSVM